MVIYIMFLQQMYRYTYMLMNSNCRYVTAVINKFKGVSRVSLHYYVRSVLVGLSL